MQKRMTENLVELGASMKQHVNRAFARSSDPATSHLAAASLDSDKLRASQSEVLHFMRLSGPVTDEQLVRYYVGTVPQSPSGLRTRRSELVARGLVEDTGQRVVLPSGRKAIVWAATSAR